MVKEHSSVRYSSITRPGQWFNRQSNDPFVKSRIKANFRSRSAFKLKELQEKHLFMKPGQVVLDLGAAPGGWTQVALDAVWPSHTTISLSSTSSSSSLLAHESSSSNAEVSLEPSPTLQTTVKSSQKPSSRHPRPSRIGRVIAVDLLGMEPIDGAEILTGDVQDEQVLQEIYALAAYPYTPQGPAVDVVISDMAHSFTGHRSTDAARVQSLCEFALGVAGHPWLLKPGGSFLCKYLRGDGDQDLRELCQSQFEKVIATKPKASRQGSAEAYFLCLGFKPLKE
ncbi:hypothetical protein BASA83_005763 [Batrachochytrium salamandrivorans]|nr:hypothetical protein BASA62_010248 [Batrachochytrium salamandrivorans]KAH9271925.1 hypothetical protein BASA83_005763 [Batrachochytrium salamandrivorans]